MYVPFNDISMTMPQCEAEARLQKMALAIHTASTFNCFRGFFFFCRLLQLLRFRFPLITDSSDYFPVLPQSTSNHCTRKDYATPSPHCLDSVVFDSFGRIAWSASWKWRRLFNLHLVFRRRLVIRVVF